MLTLGILLAISLLATLASAVVGVLFGRWAHRLSNGLLALGAVCGAVVGIAVATGSGQSLILSEALRPLLGNTADPIWSLFYNMTLGLDRFSAIFYAVMSLVVLPVAIYTTTFLERYPATCNPRCINPLAAVFVLCVQGLLLSTNIFGFMAFWLGMSLASFFLILKDISKEVRKAGFLYLIITYLSAGAIMSGLFLLSGGGLLNDFSVLAAASSQLTPTVLHIALALLLLGFGGQAGLIPFHVWLPEAYAATPTHISALLSGTLMNMAIYGLLRVLLFMAPGVPLGFVVVVIVLGLLTAIIGVLYSVLERDLKRLLAYSSAEQLGLIFAFIGIGMLAGREGSVQLTQAALYAALFLAAAHAFVMTGLFLSSGIIVGVVQSRKLEDMGGLARRMPQFSIAVFALALAGASLPPFAPFMAKWIFLQASVVALAEATLLLQVALVVMLSVVGFVSGMAVFAMVKMYAISFLANPRTDAAAAATEPQSGLLWPVMFLAVIALALGLFSPVVLKGIGAFELANTDTNIQALVVSGEVAQPVAWFVLAAVIALALVGLRGLFSNTKNERTYQTWDGGQPTNPGMEYTATAFSAPIRFFFRFFLRTQKAIVSTPIASTNPWIASRAMNLVVRQVWYDRMYVPLGSALTSIAKLVSRLQNGSIQFYICLILLTLLITLIIAL